MKTPVPISFWLIGIVALLWHAMGVMNLGMQMSPEMMSSMPADFQAFTKARPSWSTIAFGLSVVTGVLGALALLFRHRISGPLFFLSFIGALITTLQAVISGGVLQMFGPAQIAMGVLGPIVFGLFLLVYSHRCRKHGWLRGTGS